MASANSDGISYYDLLAAKDRPDAFRIGLFAAELALDLSSVLTNALLILLVCRTATFHKNLRFFLAHDAVIVILEVVVLDQDFNLLALYDVPRKDTCWKALNLLPIHVPTDRVGRVLSTELVYDQKFIVRSCPFLSADYFLVTVATKDNEFISLPSSLKQLSIKKLIGDMKTHKNLSSRGKVESHEKGQIVEAIAMELHHTVFRRTPTKSEAALFVNHLFKPYEQTSKLSLSSLINCVSKRCRDFHEQSELDRQVQLLTMVQAFQMASAAPFPLVRTFVYNQADQLLGEITLTACDSMTEYLNGLQQHYGIRADQVLEVAFRIRNQDHFAFVPTSKAHAFIQDTMVVVLGQKKDNNVVRKPAKSHLLHYVDEQEFFRCGETLQRLLLTYAHQRQEVRFDQVERILRAEGDQHFQRFMHSLTLDDVNIDDDFNEPSACTEQYQELIMIGEDAFNE